MLYCFCFTGMICVPTAVVGDNGRRDLCRGDLAISAILLFALPFCPEDAAVECLLAINSL